MGKSQGEVCLWGDFFGVWLVLVVGGGGTYERPYPWAKSSTGTVKKVMKHGCVRINGEVCTVTGQTLVPGDVVAVDAAQLCDFHVAQAQPCSCPCAVIVRTFCPMSLGSIFHISHFLAQLEMPSSLTGAPARAAVMHFIIWSSRDALCAVVCKCFTVRWPFARMRSTFSLAPRLRTFAICEIMFF